MNTVSNCIVFRSRFGRCFVLPAGVALICGLIVLAGGRVARAERAPAAAYRTAADTTAGFEALARRSLDFAAAQLRRTAEAYDPAGGYPRSTEPGGAWRLTPPSGWTSGFFPGLLWQMYDYTREPYWKEQAARWTAGLESVRHQTDTHDLGFMLFDSYGHGYRLTADTAYRAVLLDGSRHLAARFDPDVGAVKSWDWAGDRQGWDFPVIVDNMMNLELLFWAAGHGGDPAWRDLAVQHALTTARAHVRPDGSTFHVVDFDPLTGAVDARVTHQGYADASTWARGQAWAIYGFTMTYRATRDARFLETAERLADYFVERLPEDGVPYWDFDHPDLPDAERDASAAAIAASALLELSGYAGGAKAERYRDTAVHILHTLATGYLAEGTDAPSILLHAVGNRPAEDEIDVGIVYADYYFVEALLRYLNPEP